jgi:hypothetical protein
MIENTENEIRAVCNEIADMLIEKNRSYGDSALNPVRIFSKDASNIEQLNVRLDDKLSRLLRGNGNHFNEDVEKDLVGYLVLKRVAVRRIAVQKAVHVPAPPEYAQGQEAEKEEDARQLHFNGAFGSHAGTVHEAHSHHGPATAGPRTSRAQPPSGTGQPAEAALPQGGRMTPEEIKKDLRAIADGQGLHQVADPKRTAEEALKRIEELEQKPLVKKDTLVTNE